MRSRRPVSCARNSKPTRRDGWAAAPARAPHPSHDDPVDLGLRVAAGDVHAPVLVDVDVHLAADAELRQVDARLDAEASPPDHPAVLAGFEAVDVRAVAVRLLPDVVPGPVREPVAVAG